MNYYVYLNGECTSKDYQTLPNMDEANIYFQKIYGDEFNSKNVKECGNIYSLVNRLLRQIKMLRNKLNIQGE